MSEVTAIENAEVEIGDKEVQAFFEEGKEPAIEEKPKEKEVENAVQEERVETPKEERKVNYGALHEERMRRKELQAKMQKMEERFGQLVESLTPKQVPAVEENPVEHFNSRISGLEAKIKEQNELENRGRQERELVSAYQQQAAVFASETKDFGDAYKHFVGSRMSELQAMGYTPQESSQILQNEEMGIVARAMNNEVNPAALIYEAAKVRGYRKSEPKPTVDKKIETIAKGVAASKVTGGASVTAPMTLEALAEMDDDEFIKNWDKIVGKT